MLHAPFDAQTAKAAQQQWATRMNRNVVETNSIGMKLTLIPPGEFLMGNEESVDQILSAFPYAEKKRVVDASRQHRVRIEQPFYLGTYDVTRRQFARFVAEESHVTDAEKDGKGGSGYDADKKANVQTPEFN